MEAKMYVRKERFDNLAADQRRIRALEAGAVAGLAGVVSGWLIPRGSVRTVAALIPVVWALAVGFGAGWLMRSRWAMLLAPVVFMLVFELARMRVQGPTVDGIRLDNLYGAMTVVLGRGVDAPLVLLSMFVGVVYGVALAKRLQGPPEPVHRRHWLRRGFLALPTLAVIALVAGILRPASTKAAPDPAPALSASALLLAATAALRLAFPLTPCRSNKARVLSNTERKLAHVPAGD